MRYFLCFIFICLGIISNTVGAQEKEDNKQIKFSQVSLTLTSKPAGVETTITIADDRSTTLTVTGSPPRKLIVTESQIQRLSRLVEAMDIAHIDSVIFPDNLGPTTISICVVFKDKKYTVLAPFEDYGDFEDRLEPVFNFLLHTSFKVVGEKDSEDF